MIGPSIVSAPPQLARTPPTPPHAVLQPPLAAPPSGKAKLPSAAFPRNTRLEPRLSANSTHPRRRACVCESVAVAVSVSVFRRVSYLPLLITLRLRGHRIRGSSLPEFRIAQHIPLVGLQRRLAAHGRVSGLSSPARLVALLATSTRNCNSRRVASWLVGQGVSLRDERPPTDHSLLPYLGGIWKRAAAVI